MRILKSFRFWLPVGFLFVMLSASFIIPAIYPELLEPGPPYLKDDSGKSSESDFVLNAECRIIPFPKPDKPLSFRLWKLFNSSTY